MIYKNNCTLPKARFAIKRISGGIGKTGIGGFARPCASTRPRDHAY